MKSILSFIVVALASCSAAAQVVAPAGADLQARISEITASAVVVDVVKPPVVETVWDKMSAELAGCRIKGTRKASPGGRMSLEFGVLMCAGQPAVNIQAFGVASVRHRVDLDIRAGVGAPLAILVLADISLPGRRPWTDAMK